MSRLVLDVAIQTRGRCGTVPMKDITGRDVLVAIVKFTFAVSPAGEVELLSPGADIDLVDTFHGEDGASSSIRRPSQLFDHKPGTDVVMVGHAHPDPRRPSATSVDVSLRVGSLTKTVRAHGLRAWQQGARGSLAPGPARPIKEPIPLVYELAWGGMDMSEPDALPLCEPRNLLGRGVSRAPKRLVGEPAAQLEDPAHPIDGPTNVPACFGPIHRNWEPRSTFVGTYDELWMDTRMPILPLDFDARHHVCVPHDQWSPAPLRGDEPIEILGATREGRWAFQLPRIAPGFSSVAMGRRSEHRTHLDLLWIDADARTVELSFHASIPLPRKFELLDKIVFLEKNIRG